MASNKRLIVTLGCVHQLSVFTIEKVTDGLHIAAGAGLRIYLPGVADMTSSVPIYHNGIVYDPSRLNVSTRTFTST